MKAGVALLGAALVLIGWTGSGQRSPEQVRAQTAAVPGAKLLRAERPVPGQYIVVFDDETAPVVATSDELIRRFGGTRLFTYEHALRGFAVRMPEETALRLAQDPRVKYVEEDGEVKAVDTQDSPPWGLDRVDQRDRWLDGLYNYRMYGSGVNAYVIDTGIRVTHVEFGGRASLDYTAINDGRGANDCNGHGTHVAGTIGGATYGVAKKVRLRAVRVLDCNGSGTWSGVIAGVDFVTANAVKPAVANMSLAGGANQSVDDAVRRSIKAGITYALAAANSSADACNFSPARTKEAITVGATDSNDAVAYYSNQGSCLDLFAPGSSVLSAYHTSDTATAYLSGTSMASPHVAGAAALYLSGFMNANPAQVAEALIGRASVGKLTGLTTGSPNLLLYADIAGPGCPGSAGGYLGCRGNGCAVCNELVKDYPCYFDNHKECSPNFTCGSQYYACNSNCPPPTEADRCTTVACNGTAGQWNGCRGNGCSVCDELVKNYPRYFDNHPGCARNFNCGGQYFTCNSKCPAPTAADM